MLEKILEPTYPITEIEVSELYTTFAYLYSPTFTYKGEMHNSWEIVFVNNGEVVVETDNETFILKKNQAIIHKPNEFHKIRANNKPCNVGIISFGSKSAKLFEIVDKIINITDTEKDRILSIIDEGLILMAGKNWMPPYHKNEKNPTPYGAGQLIKNNIECLLISFVRKFAEEQIPEKNLDSVSFNKNNIVQSAVLYINNNFDKNLSLDKISKAVGYSVSYISSVFKKHLGTSLINYYLNVRIIKAKQLIEENKMSFKQIAESLNFDSVQYFSTQFKKITKLTPSQYLLMLKMRNYNHDDITTYLLK